MWRKMIHATTLIALYVVPWLVFGAVVWGMWHGLTSHP